MLVINSEKLKQLIEAALFVAQKPLSIKVLKSGVLATYDISSVKIREQIVSLQNDYIGHGIELVQVASGYRFQSLDVLSEDLAALFKEKAPRYSQALLETLALIAYQQPITRSDIEGIRGVSVSSYIMKSLLERNWVKIIGHKEVPGRPALYATTSEFLDYFSLSSLKELPELLSIETQTNLETRKE